ncbi:M56 family metallopeptidase [Mycolicibacterium fortuitum]
MSLAACLMIYSAVVLVVGPAVLRRLSRAGHAPRLGVTAWLAAIGSVLVTWLVVAGLLAVDVAAHWGQRNSFVVACVAALCELAAGDAGRAAQVGVLVGLATVAVVMARFTIRIGRTIARLRAQAHGHAQAIRLVGRPTPDDGVYVVDATARAAYCVSGRPSAIVVTSSAIAALDRHELGAVIAHERAHLRGHHPAVMTVLRGLALVFPRLGLMTQAAREVSRLLEMCADDAAARRHGRDPLINGLMALVGVAPAAALGAADVAVLSRAERLLSPPQHRARIGAQLALAGAAALIIAAPMTMVALGAAGILVCS